MATTTSGVSKYAIKVWPKKKTTSDETAKKYAEQDSATDRFSISNSSSASDKYSARYNSSASAAGVQYNQYLVGFRKYWFRFEFNDPVIGFYVDWDDGEDNSSEKSNSQVVYLEKPQFYGVVSHIFTKSGKHFPLVRAISADGFWSKYYTSSDTDNEYSALEERTLTEGQNEISLVSLVESEDYGFPWFYPTTLPPVGVLKADRKTVYTGINNEAVHASFIRRGGPSVVYAWFSNGDSVAAKAAAVDVTYETTNGFVKTTTIYTDHANASAAHPVALGDVWKILEVKLNKIKENTTADDTSSALLHSRERVYLRWSTVSIHKDADEDVITGEEDGSEGDKWWLKSAGIGEHIGTSASVIIAGTANHDTVETGISRFTVSALAQPGDTFCTVTTSAPHHIPDGEVVTLVDCGSFTGEQTITSIVDPSNFRFSSGATTGVSAGGSATATVKNAVRFEGAKAAATEANTGWWGIKDTSMDAAICNVSNGWPLLNLNDRAHFVTIDLSESRTRAPGLSITETAGSLMLDDGNSDWAQQDAGGAYATDLLDELRSGKYINRLTSYRTRLEWSQDPFRTTTGWNGFRDYIDNRTTGGTYRFFDSYRLLRCQVKDDRTEQVWDKFAYSEIESFNDYSQSSNLTKVFPPEVEKRNDIFMTSNGGTNWVDVSFNNRTTSTELRALTEQTSIDGSPNNWILYVNSERKFDRLFVQTMNNFANDVQAQKGGKCRITLQYPAYDARLDETKFRAIPFSDFTKTPIDDTSLYLSGPLVFEAPDNWQKVSYTGVTWPIALRDKEESYDKRASDWSWDAYAVLISITCQDVSTSVTPNIDYIMPYDNEHSEVIKVMDSMHVSLNDVVIAQSLSFKRAGKYIKVNDRIGRSELRKIGAEGGSIRFGGISFGDYSTAAATGYDSYEIVRQHQQEGTPVFLDLKRPNGEYVRFFGKITDLSEDIPTGRTSNKWAVSMATEAVAEFTTDGTWLSDGMISLGGVLENEPKYI